MRKSVRTGMAGRVVLSAWLITQGLSLFAMESAKTNAPAANSFEAFQIISQRNVFNTSRNPGSKPGEEAPPPPKIEAFALVGTISYAKGDFAFFDGNNSAFKKVAQPGEKVGDCTVASIAHDHVRLKMDARELDLPVNMQLRRENNGEWQLLEVAETFTPPSEPDEVEHRPGTPPRNGVTAMVGGSASVLSEKQIKKFEKVAKDEMLKADKVMKELKSLSEAKPPKKSDKRSRDKR